MRESVERCPRCLEHQECLATAWCEHCVDWLCDGCWVECNAMTHQLSATG